MPNLRTRLLRLARKHPHLRAEVGKLLHTADLGIVSNAARTAFETELLPQIASMVQSPQQVEAVGDHLHTLLDSSLAKKDSLYLLLIRYKSIDMSDQGFFKDLKLAVDSWVRQYTFADDAVR